MKNQNETIQCDSFNQKTAFEISKGIFGAIFNLWPHLVMSSTSDILNFERFVTRNC